MSFEDACMKWRGKLLTGEFAHCCDRWDGLPVDETAPEWPCGCFDTNEMHNFTTTQADRGAE